MAGEIPRPQVLWTYGRTRQRRGVMGARRRELGAGRPGAQPNRNGFSPLSRSSSGNGEQFGLPTVGSARWRHWKFLQDSPNAKRNVLFHIAVGPKRKELVAEKLDIVKRCSENMCLNKHTLKGGGRWKHCRCMGYVLTGRVGGGEEVRESNAQG